MKFSCPNPSGCQHLSGPKALMGSRFSCLSQNFDRGDIGAAAIVAISLAFLGCSKVSTFPKRFEAAPQGGEEANHAASKADLGTNPREPKSDPPIVAKLKHEADESLNW